MKKYLILIILIAQPIISELVLEITKGSDNPYSVALINFEGSKSVTNEITNIIKNDLNRTGEFKILENNKLLSIPKNAEDIKYGDFKILGIKSIISIVMNLDIQDLLLALFNLINT